MKMLITGGAGFIGSHLCDSFVADQHQVLCLDNFMNGNLMNIRHLLTCRNFKLINGDIRNFDLLEKIARDVDVILHLAAQIHVDRSIIEPKLTYEINVLGTQNVLEVARMYDVEKVLHASTSEVYGSAQYVPMDEKHPLNAPHPYGASKIAGDRMCHAYTETYGLNVAVLRPFNVFGPKQKDTGYGGAISLFTKRILSNVPPVIFGDGTQTRDYTYVDDIVDAYKLTLAYKGRITGPMNFGTGEEVRIVDLANLIIKICGKKMRAVHVEPRPGEVKRLVADVSKARDTLGWRPRHNLQTSLRKFVEWYRNYKSEEWAKPS